MSALGTETLEAYYDVELTRAAHKLVTEMRPVEPDQQVLITADTAADACAVQATAGAVYAVGGIPTVARYHTLPEPMQEPPQPVTRAVMGDDIWFDFSVAYQLYSLSYHAAIENGCIYVRLTGMDVDVTNPAGTDLLMEVDKAGDPFWGYPPSEGGYPQMLGGQSGFMIHRQSCEGELVFDGTLCAWPSKAATLGRLRAAQRLPSFPGG